MPPALRRGWFADHSPGRGGIIKIIPEPPAPCVFNIAPLVLGNLAGGANSAAWGTSTDGNIVVGFGDDAGSVTHALTWTGAGAPAILTPLATATFSEALGCSANGNIIVGNCTVSAAQRATAWTAGAAAALSFLPTSTTNRATYCSSDGTIIVGSSKVGGIDHAVFWTNGVITDLGNFSGGDAVAFGCSANGSVVVGQGFTGGIFHALKWVSGGAAVDLGALVAGHQYRALKCSSDGSIIVGDAEDAGGVLRAVYWNGTGIHKLNVDSVLPDDTNSLATGISADGAVIGGYTLTSENISWPLVWREGVVSVMRLGDVTGSELVTNGTFSGSATGWTLGNNVTYGANRVTSAYNGGDPTISQATIATTANGVYEIIFTISSASVGAGATLYFTGGNSFSSTAKFGNGTYSVVFLANFTGTDTLVFDDYAYVVGDTWTLDNVSMKELTAAAQPALFLEVQNISPDGETIVGRGVYNSGAFPLGALEWKCV